jgi:cysteinyl-tRNA synthetase
MTDIYLSNTLAHKKEKFVPVKEGHVGIYSCGPTVYWNQHIGHMYAYVQWDLLARFLRHVGYEVMWVVNITDVGHMTSDDDWGEDKMEKGAKREGVSLEDLAEKYIKQFSESLNLLNVTRPDVLPRATEHIQEQINLAKKIEDNGFTYRTKMGLVYDTSKFADYTKFANLKLEDQKSRKDVEVDPEKKRAWDFFLWVTGNPKHIMQWDSPWGKGYPGWHLECTAMSVKYLGDNFDIHTGGIEHIPVHHTNEIAQGYGAFGKQTANYWLHNAHLLGSSGDKMSKSLGNFVTVQDLVKKGYDPLSLRYLFLNSHYKKGLSFSTKSLDSAQAALEKLKEQVSSLRNQAPRKALSEEKLQKVQVYQDKFINALADDLNIAQALAVLWEMLKSNIPAEDKYDLALSFDEVLGLKLAEAQKVEVKIPGEVNELVNRRESLRKAGKFEEADKVRKEIEAKGFTVRDTSQGSVLEPLKE